jgi:hypothetical protein
MKPSLSIPFTVILLAAGPATATLEIGERLTRAHDEFLDSRRAALPELSDPFGVPAAATAVPEPSFDRIGPAGAWRGNVVATVFWVGERPTENNPTPNDASAWDPNWEANFGGYDHPQRRDGYLPAGFTPKLNPFYVALPYNDIGTDFRHRPEAAEVIPWFWRDFDGNGLSVCKGRWVAIHRDGRVCYAQWEDVGPFQTDHWQYVFGGQPPRDNRNGGAGIDLSPAVRDYLRLQSGERVQWRFVNDRDVPPGPWRDWRPTSGFPDSP